jgi:pyruvate dehydrogenase E1 component
MHREELTISHLVINSTCSGWTAWCRGNGKIIQELEAQFRGAGSERDQGHLGPTDPLLAQDVDGVRHQMNTTPESRCSRPTRLVRRSTSGELLRPTRGSADGRAPVRMRPAQPVPRRARLPQVYAAFKAATEHVGQPTVILARRSWLDVSRPRAGPQRHPPDEEG